MVGEGYQLGIDTTIYDRLAHYKYTHELKLVWCSRAIVNNNVYKDISIFTKFK